MISRSPLRTLDVFVEKKFKTHEPSSMEESGPPEKEKYDHTDTQRTSIDDDQFGFPKESRSKVYDS